MSVDRSVYVGPYVRVPQVDVDRLVKYFGCEVCRSIKTDGRFCSSCGAPLKDYDVLARVPVSSFEVTDRIDQRLSRVNLDSDLKSVFYVPNVGFSVKRECHFNCRDSFVVGLGDDMAVSEVALFRKDFASDLKVLLEVYGSFDVLWGVLFWFS